MRRFVAMATRDGREPTVYEMTKSELRGTIQIAVITALLAVGLLVGLMRLVLGIL